MADEADVGRFAVPCAAVVDIWLYELQTYWNDLDYPKAFQTSPRKR